ncbi:MAG: type II toxin-antitoxin system RelE/ParE family toxin [Bacteroidia bacterium]
MQVIFTEQAKRDLDEIRRHFSEVAPYKTDEIILEILNRTHQLESFPQSGPEDEFLKSCGLSRRYLVEGNYKIIYRIDGDIVSITQVFGARQDPDSIVAGESI